MPSTTSNNSIDKTLIYQEFCFLIEGSGNKAHFSKVMYFIDALQQWLYKQSRVESKAFIFKFLLHKIPVVSSAWQKSATLMCFYHLPRDELSFHFHRN